MSNRMEYLSRKSGIRLISKWFVRTFFVAIGCFRSLSLYIFSVVGGGLMIGLGILIVELNFQSGGFTVRGFPVAGFGRDGKALTMIEE